MIDANICGMWAPSELQGLEGYGGLSGEWYDQDMYFEDLCQSQMDGWDWSVEHH